MKENYAQAKELYTEPELEAMGLNPYDIVTYSQQDFGSEVED